jgi:hypothetical protein
MAWESNKAAGFRSGAQSLRAMAATELDRELALLMLAVAEDIERYVAERLEETLPAHLSDVKPR